MQPLRNLSWLLAAIVVISTAGCQLAATPTLPQGYSERSSAEPDAAAHHLKGEARLLGNLAGPPPLALPHPEHYGKSGPPPLSGPWGGWVSASYRASTPIGLPTFRVSNAFAENLNFFETLLEVVKRTPAEGNSTTTTSELSTEAISTLNVILMQTRSQQLRLFQGNALRWQYPAQPVDTSSFIRWVEVRQSEWQTFHTTPRKRVDAPNNAWRFLFQTKCED